MKEKTKEAIKFWFLFFLVIILLNWYWIGDYISWKSNQGYFEEYYQENQEEIDKFFNEEKRFIEKSTFFVNVENSKEIKDLKEINKWKDKNKYFLRNANLKLGNKYLVCNGNEKYIEVIPKNPVVVDTLDYLYYQHNYETYKFTEKDISKYVNTKDNKELEKRAKKDYKCKYYYIYGDIENEENSSERMARIFYKMYLLFVLFIILGPILVEVLRTSFNDKDKEAKQVVKVRKIKKISK